MVLANRDVAAAGHAGRRRQRLRRRRPARSRRGLHRHRARAHDHLPVHDRRRLRRPRRAPVRPGPSDRRPVRRDRPARRGQARQRRHRPRRLERGATSGAALALAALAAGRQARRQHGGRAATVAAQVLRLAVPTSAGSQGPFVAAGRAGASPSRRPAPPRLRRTTRWTRCPSETLTKVGTTAQNMVMAVDGTAEPGAPKRRHDLPDPQGDAAGRRARRSSSPPCSCRSPPSPSTSSPTAGGRASGCAPRSCAPACTSPRGSSSSRSSTSPTSSACCRTAPTP